MYRFASTQPTPIHGRSLRLGVDFQQVLLAAAGRRVRATDPLYALYPEFCAFRPDGSLGNKDPGAMVQGYRLSDIGAGVELFLALNTESMTVAEVYLYTNSVNDPATATITDVSEQLAPGGGTYTHFVGTAFTPTYFWLKTVDDSGNETAIIPLGSKSTEDNTPPVVTSATLALDEANPTQKVHWTFAGSDNDAIQSFYVLLSETQDTLPTAAEVKAQGSAFPAVVQAGNFEGLKPGTQYYGWVVATDRAGNDSVVTATTPASVTTDPDVTPPTLDSSSLTATPGAEETSIDVTVAISDAVA